MSEMYFLPFRPAFDSAGVSVPGSQHYFTLTGTNTPSAPYTDEALTTRHANPVIANGAGFLPPVYLNPSVTYRVRIYDANAEVGVDTPLEEYDPYVPSLYGGDTLSISQKLFGSDLGPVTGGARSDLTSTTTFTAADSGSGVYKINNQINCVGSTNVGAVRSLYSGANLMTTAGTCGLLSGAHFFTWMMGQGNVTTNKVVEAHMVAGRDSNGVDLVSPGTVTGDSMFFNTAGITLGANIVLPKVYGYNAGQLTDLAKVVLAYGYNCEHNQSTAVGGEFMGFRSQVRNAPGNWSFVANTNDASPPAPAAFGGKVRIGGLTVPLLECDVTGAVGATGEITSTGGRIGYSGGAGGAVAQTTSRTTSVTLNKMCGQLILVNAAGSTSWQTFTVNNTNVSTLDSVRVTQKSGTDKYMIHVTRTVDGAFDVTFATMGGTTTEQPVFNFSIIKGVNA